MPNSALMFLAAVPVIIDHQHLVTVRIYGRHCHHVLCNCRDLDVVIDLVVYVEPDALSCATIELMIECSFVS